jgi:hypothetical protein
MTEPALVARWFGWEHDSLDDEIAMIFVDAMSRSRERLRLETNGGGLFTLHEDRAGTVLELRRPAPDDGVAFDAIDEGWTTFVQQLRLGLERHPDEERRCLELQGKHGPDGGHDLHALLGLEAAAGLQSGARYAATTPFGEELTGEVWFRSEHQLGLTVDGWGDGLLVAVRRPPDDQRPYGGAQLVLTSYGLDDAAFAGWFERWTRYVTASFLR